MDRTTLDKTNDIKKYFAANSILSFLKVKLFETKTVGQIMNGYEDSLMSFGKSIHPKMFKSSQLGLLSVTQFYLYNIFTQI